MLTPHRRDSTRTYATVSFTDYSNLIRNIGISSCGTYTAGCSLRYAKIKARQATYPSHGTATSQTAAKLLYSVQRKSAVGDAVGKWSLHRALSEKTGGRRDAFPINAIMGMASARAADSECHRRPDGVVVHHSPPAVRRAKARVRGDRFACPARQACDTAGVPRGCAPPGKLWTGTGSDHLSGHRKSSGQGKSRGCPRILPAIPRASLARGLPHPCSRQGGGDGQVVPQVHRVDRNAPATHSAISKVPAHRR
jgi:hypothetical protein